MKRLLAVLAVAASFSQVCIAHEGHDKTPGAVAAPHGGVVKGTDQLYLELVNEMGGVKIYPLTHDFSAIPLKEVTLSATVTFPRKSKTESVKLTQGDDHFSAKVDSKGAHRYSLDLLVTYKGKKEKLKFQVEPQS